MDWHGIKVWLELISGLDMDALHVHAGILGQLAAALVIRKPLRNPLPWLAVLVAVLVNEAYDYHYEVWPDRDEQFGESVRDFWNTMALPSLIFLVARFYPRLLVGREASAPDPG